jgi:hypothetical protein
MMAPMRSLVFLALVACSPPTTAPTAPTIEVPVGSASAALIDPALAPIPVPSARPAALTTDVSGTTWSFCSKEDETVTFEADGSATFRRDGQANPQGLACGKAHWSQTGTRVTFDCKAFTEYVADISVGGDSMRGEWHRVAKPTDRGDTCLKRAK